MCCHVLTWIRWNDCYDRAGHARCHKYIGPGDGVYRLAVASLAAGFRAEAPALRLNDEVLNWRELCTRVDALATGFAAQGVKGGDGVLLRARNHPSSALAWLALLQCGARVLPVNPQLPQPLLDALIPDLTLRFALDLQSNDHFSGLMPLQIQQLSGEHAADWLPLRLSSMTLTSGSTGLPKAAVHTCQAHLASAQGCCH